MPWPFILSSNSPCHSFCKNIKIKYFSWPCFPPTPISISISFFLFLSVLFQGLLYTCCLCSFSFIYTSAHCPSASALACITKVGLWKITTKESPDPVVICHFLSWLTFLPFVTTSSLGFHGTIYFLASPSSLSVFLLSHLPLYHILLPLFLNVHLHLGSLL